MAQPKIPEDAKFALPGLVLGFGILLLLAGVGTVLGLRSGFYGLWPDVGY